MPEVLLPNVRRYSDIHFRLSISDSGVPVSWDSTTIMRLFMYSEKQRGFGGKCSFQVNDDPHYLDVTFHAYNQQFLGIHRVVIQIEIEGNVNTYDARVCNIVASTSNEPDIYDDVIDVPIEVAEVDTTVLYEILAACKLATSEATGAAERAEGAFERMLGGRKNEVLTKLSDSPLDMGWKPSQGSGGSRPYVSLERLRGFLYRVTFDALPEADELVAPVVGGCSAYVRDGKLYRNLDFKFDNAASFIVRTKDFEGMSFITGLNDGDMDDELIAQLPYRMVDGRNNYGIMVSVHVLFNDWQYSGAGDRSIPLTRLPFEVLSRVKSMATISTDLANVLGNVAITEAMGDYLLQVLVTDGTTTCALIPPEADGLSYVLVDASSNPKMSNFRWIGRDEVSRSDADLQTRPTGIERYNMMPCALPDLRFTKAYETPGRLSEFIGIDGTTKASTDAELEAVYDEARAEYLDRQRDGKTWQTMHSVVYGDRMEHLYVQEDWTDDVAVGGVSKEYVDGEIERMEDKIPTKTSDLTNDSDFQTEAEVDTKVDTEKTRAEGIEASLETNINTIEGKIPSQASSSNQLADKAFVNSSVQTAAANFRGNWATKSAIPTDYTLYPADYAGNKKPTTNDYLVVQVDESEDGGTWRYKYTGDWDTDGVSGWNAEYEVNETPLTAAQLAALNSGITATKVLEIAGKYVKPQTGIPATDLASGVQTTLGKVTELESEVGDLQDLWEKGEGQHSIQKKGAFAIGQYAVAEGIGFDAGLYRSYEITKLSSVKYELGFVDKLALTPCYHSMIANHRIYGIQQLGEEPVPIEIKSNPAPVLDEDARTITVYTSTDLTAFTDIYCIIAATGDYSHSESHGMSIGDDSHSEGSGISVGSNTHTEGDSTIALNHAEHAEGYLNMSHKVSDTFGDPGNTANSVGIGNPSNGRRNAEEIMQNGDLYIKGVGGYDGTNPNTTGVKTLQDVVNQIPNKADKVFVASSIPADGLLPNILYNVGTLTGAVTINLATPTDSTVMNIYHICFETGETAPTITWGSAITSWMGGSAPTINANKHYEVSVLNGVAIAMEV